MLQFLHGRPISTKNELAAFEEYFCIVCYNQLRYLASNSIALAIYREIRLNGISQQWAVADPLRRIRKA
jgi:hypothetical protein